MSLPPLHRTLEQCAFRALPALHTESYDGWLVRMAGGGPRRANSVNVLDASTLPLEQKIDRCERLMRADGVVPTFRLTQHEVDPGLDAMLAAHDYERQDESIVMSLSLDGVFSGGVATELAPAQWLSLLHEIDQGSVERKRKHAALLERLTLPAVYGAIEEGVGYAAMGLAVLDGSMAGLFDVATRPEARRRGHARRLTFALLAMARRRGAELAYLQVVAANQAAVALYADLGFEECYRYWYRVLP